jgi:hypothetical protein
MAKELVFQLPYFDDLACRSRRNLPVGPDAAPVTRTDRYVGRDLGNGPSASRIGLAVHVRERY